jgi:hypothetical protein
MSVPAEHIDAANAGPLAVRIVDPALQGAVRAVADDLIRLAAAASVAVTFA